MNHTKQLLARLPELNWQLTQTNPVIWQQLLPKGLFRQSSYFTPSAVILELEDDLNAILQLDDGASRQHKIKKIEQKIQVLVTLCRLQKKYKNQSSEPEAKLLDKICKRGEWVMKLEQDIKELNIQKAALKDQLEHPKKVDITLELQRQIGRIEQLIGKHQEALARL